MNYLKDFLGTQEVQIVILIAIIILVIGTVYYTIESYFKKSKNIKKKNTLELNNLVNENIEVLDDNDDSLIPVVVSDRIEKEEKPQVVPLNVEPKEKVRETLADNSIKSIFEEVKNEVEILKLDEEKDKKEEQELKYTEITPSKEEAREEIRKATEELIKTQEEQAKDNIDLTKFEEEQEENAIISLDELMTKSSTLYEKNEVTQYADEGNEPISLQDLEKRMNNIKEEIINLENEDLKENKEEVIKTTQTKLDDFNTIETKSLYKEDKVFKSSPIISPIFGIEKKTVTNENMELENTANYEKLDDEIRKTNEFLGKLRELQKKLD